MRSQQTKYWVVDKDSDKLTDCPQIKEAALWIKSGEVVAFPTETVYGLGANAFLDSAVEKIFLAKGRPSDNPLIVHIANEQQLDQLTNEISTTTKKLIDAFWPGPLTLIVKKSKPISTKVTAGLDTVAIRMPDHPVALSLIERAGVPVAAPSANLSGKPSPTKASHVYQDLNGRIAGIVDGGDTGIGLESTVVDCTGEIPMILRPGGITKEQLEEVIVEVQIDQALKDQGQAPRSPGMKYKHYAPDAPFIVVEGTTTFIQQLINDAKSKGKKVGVLSTKEHKENYDADVVISCGSRHDLLSVANHVYHVLRSFNEYDVDVIYSESFPNEGVGVAIMNRLLKAANGQVIRESEYNDKSN